MNLRTSVGVRLFLLVGCQTAIAAILVFTALRTLSIIAADYRYMYEFQFQSIYAIEKAMEGAESAQEGVRSPQLESFYHSYRAKWEVAGGNTSDAIRFREDLSRIGETSLPNREAELVASLRQSIRSGDVQSIRKELADLYEVNVRYADLANLAVTKGMTDLRWRLIAFGLGNIVLTLFLGLHVRSAIAPRIHRLVGHVQRFQMSGEHEKITDEGNDDIAVLANALNAGFAAIALRDREREHFLAVAAHELKTPVTSIQGYASLLVASPQNPPEVARALEVIHRQAWRLSRLIEMLFLSMRARTHSLRFEPRPLELSGLVKRVLDELGSVFPKKAFVPNVDEKISILGDEKLMEHALWVLFTCAAALCRPNAAVPVSLCLKDRRANLTVALDEGAGSPRELDELFRPFQSIQYESSEGVRSAVGLFLCREIVRVHNGRLYVHQQSGGAPEFVMELPQ